MDEICHATEAKKNRMTCRQAMSGQSGQTDQLSPKGQTHELCFQPFGHLPLTVLTGLTELDIERNKIPFRLKGPLVRSGVS